MVDLTELSRRDRQIMEILYAAEGATVTQVMAELPNAPTDNAVRRLLQILEDKGYVQRTKVGREHIYHPIQSKKQAGKKALQRLLDTFFDGAIDQAFAVHLGGKDPNLSEEQLSRMMQMIKEARKKGR